MWNSHSIDQGRNESTTTCATQSVGYIISLQSILASSSASTPSLTDGSSTSDNGPLTGFKSRNAAILLIVAIVWMALSILTYPYGIISLSRTYDVRSNRLKLYVLRVAFMANVVTTIFLTISSAKVTASAMHMVGTATAPLAGSGNNGVAQVLQVQAWMGKEFFAFTWLATGLMWVNLVLAVSTAFKIGNDIERLGLVPGREGNQMKGF